MAKSHCYSPVITSVTGTYKDTGEKYTVSSISVKNAVEIIVDYFSITYGMTRETVMEGLTLVQYVDTNKNGGCPCV